MTDAYRFSLRAQIPEGGPSELRGAPDSSLPGHGRGGYANGGAVSAGGPDTSGARAMLTGSLPGTEDHAAWIVDSRRATGSQTGPPAGEDLSRPSQSSTSQAPASRTTLLVHVSLLQIGRAACRER